MRQPSASASDRATVRTLSYAAPDGAARGVVDVLFDGQRVWSTTAVPSADGIVQLTWPKALRPHLVGTGTVAVRDAASGAMITEIPVSWRGSGAPLSVADASGRGLVMNKWNRLGHSIGSSDTSLRTRLLDSTERLLGDLRDTGYTAYLCSGTLLGAVRSGTLLPHDDDADIGLLLDSTSPADLTLDSFRLERVLDELGYIVVRHASSHLQITFYDEDGLTDHYVDIFLAFFRGDDFCQPIHIRTPLDRSSIVPLSTVVLEDREFVAPAVPEHWLAACYGDDWLTPDPSFTFQTPQATRRRFRNWFGSQNGNREFWEEHWSAIDETPAPMLAERRLLRELKTLLPTGAPVLEIGSGAGGLSTAIARAGHEVLGIEFMRHALVLAQRHSSAAQWRFGNAYDRRGMLALAAELVRDGRPWHVVMDHLLDRLTDDGRATVLLTLRELLEPDAFAVATIDTNFVMAGYSHFDPTTWQYSVNDLQRDAARHGLSTQVVSHGLRRTSIGTRTTATVTLTRERKVH
ncbi:MAG: LicD family protein [Microbacterium sp.]